MHIACVNTGPKYGPEYVTTLQSMVRRHAPEVPFVCYTDNPVVGVMCKPLPVDLPGYWSKVGLFKIPEPLVYLDLDIVITGSLAPLLEWKGFGIIDDWWSQGFNSSVMVLTGKEHQVFDRFTPSAMVRCREGDQQWITEQLPNAKTFPAAWFPSWKASNCAALTSPPDGSIATVFHGSPKPPDIKSGWVIDHWR